MPCRREEEEDAGDEGEEEAEEEDGDGDSFLLLQQSVTLGGSGDVDRLVARIGETLQLDAAAHDRPEPARAPPGPPALPWLPPPPALAPAPAPARDPAAFGAWRCALGDRGRVRGRAAPYFVAEQLPVSGPGALSTLPSPPCFEEGPPGADPRAVPQPLSGPCRRGWLRGAAASRRLQLRRGAQAEARPAEDDPHRLLQQLVLSGNLIKEAVRRLHSRRLRFHAKLPQRQHLGPTLEPRAEPCSPRAAYGHPDAPGRRVQFKTSDGVLVPGS